MSKRLQVIMDDREMREIRQAARRNRTTVAEWVRRALRAAREHEPRSTKERKLAAIRRAMTYSAPTGPIEQILEETERGYLQEDLP